MRSLLRRLHYLLHRSRAEAELAEELAFHEEMKRRHFEGTGLSTVEAQRSARRALGNVTLATDETRDVWLPRGLQGTGQDIRLALRTLRKTPVVTAAAVLSIALGIGANTTLFSVLDALVLRPLPVEQPDRLVFVRGGAAADGQAFTAAVWRELRNRSPFENLASWSIRRFKVGSGSDAHAVQGMWCSGSYFDTLGVRAVLGRTFTPTDDRPGSGPDGPVAVIGYGFWQREFGGAPDVIGRTLRVEGVPFTIIGVTPASFVGTDIGREFEVAVPLETEPLMDAPSMLDPESGTQFLLLVGRLGPHQTPEEARAALQQLQPAIREATIGPVRKFGADAVSHYLAHPFTVAPAATGTSTLRDAYERPLTILMIVVIAVMVIACANIANLLLARAIARRGEIDVRTALGASRWRIARQLFTESAVLSMAGGTLGLVIAHDAAAALVAQLSTPNNPVYLDLTLDARVLSFTAVLTIFTTLLFGTLPAFRAARARLDPLGARRVTQPTLTSGGLASWLLVGQVALAMVLLVAGVLFVRTFIALATRPLGFDPDAVMVSVVAPPQTIAPDDRIPMYGRVLAAARTVPGVDAASVSLVSPVAGGQYTPPIEILDAQASHRGEHPFANLISPGWFGTYRIPLIAGRDFNDDDRRGGTRVAVVNQAFARRFFGNAPPLGRMLALYPGTPMTLSPIEVVGLATDAVYSSLRQPAPPTLYLPIDQMDTSSFPLLRQNIASAARLSVRIEHGTPQAVSKRVAAAAAAVEPRLAITFQALAQQIGASIRQDRSVAWLAGLFAALALLLTALGLYGLIAYGVQARRRELGIRTALGATAPVVVSLVLRRVALLTAIGLSAGIALALWFGGGVATMLYGVKPHDLPTLAAAAAVLALVAGAAAIGPTHAALRVSPAEILKDT